MENLLNPQHLGVLGSIVVITLFGVYQITRTQMSQHWEVTRSLLESFQKLSVGLSKLTNSIARLDKSLSDSVLELRDSLHKIDRLLKELQK